MYRSGTRVDEWDRWYDEQHVPDMLSCGAFSAMSRWRRVPPLRVGPNHLTLYDVATDTVDEAVARSAATLAEIVAAGRKHDDAHRGVDGDPPPDRSPRRRRVPA